MVLAAVIDLGGPAGWVALLMPLLVLGVVMIGVVVGRDKAPAAHATHRASPAQSSVATDQTSTPPAQPSPSPSPSPSPQPSQPPLLPNRSLQPATAPRRAEPPPRPPTAEGRRRFGAGTVGVGAGSDKGAGTPPADPQADVEATRATPAAAETGDAAPWGAGARQNAGTAPLELLEAALAEAEQRFDDPAVARVSLQFARALIGTGAMGEVVKSHLRRSIIIASRLKDHETHALARLELGDQMAEEGDMTTACEHWQIARQIYWDAHSDQIGPVDDRMRTNGCPTDWVLNDF